MLASDTPDAPDDPGPSGIPGAPGNSGNPSPSDTWDAWTRRLRPRRDGILPPHYRRRSLATVLAFGAIVLLAAPQLATTPSQALLVNQWLLYSIAALGFYLIFAVSGQFALSQAFMMGLGGYASAWASEHHGFWIGLVVALVVTVVVATAFSLAVRRASAFYFAVATLGLAAIGLTLFEKLSDITGPGGQRANVPPPELFGVRLITGNQTFKLILAFLVVGLVLVALIERSALRRTTIAVRDAELVSRTVGLSVVHNRVVLFTVGSCYASVAGALLAHSSGFISPESFGTSVGIGIFLMVVLGGTGSMWGSVLGAAFYVFVPEELSFLQRYKEIFFGLLLVAVMIALPDGLVGLARRIATLPGKVRRARP